MQKELGLQRDAFAIVNTIKEQRLQIEKAKRLKELADNYSANKPLHSDWVRVSVNALGMGSQTSFAELLRLGT